MVPQEPLFTKSYQIVPNMVPGEPEILGNAVVPEEPKFTKSYQQWYLGEQKIIKDFSWFLRNRNLPKVT